MTSIFIVSGGTGFSGEQLVRTALAQFPLFLQGGFAVVDITNKPVEVSAREILEAVGR
jgi:regulator of PEP synthase PpsR (kinase-PPPase family)